MTTTSRRRLLAGLGMAGLAGCLSAGFPGTAPRSIRTVYLGAYHWGFVLLDENGVEQQQVVFDVGTRVRIVAFNTEAHRALDRLPAGIQSALPDHEALEERNELRIPQPTTGTMHEALEVANEQYPNHSLAVVPIGYGRQRAPMGGAMMHNSLWLPHEATQPTTVEQVAERRGDYTLACLTYCGYGHPYMTLPGAFVVR